mmetsp:Transcript_1172/g.2566  ORF Transcript_1172/g.2566 Transcript_1172/m.2566 type:complete len:410 (-) Transcript_1172:763-1992(-)
MFAQSFRVDVEQHFPRNHAALLVPANGDLVAELQVVPSPHLLPHPLRLPQLVHEPGVRLFVVAQIVVPPQQLHRVLQRLHAHVQDREVPDITPKRVHHLARDPQNAEQAHLLRDQKDHRDHETLPEHHLLPLQTGAGGRERDLHHTRDAHGGGNQIGVGRRILHGSEPLDLLGGLHHGIHVVHAHGRPRGRNQPLARRGKDHAQRLYREVLRQMLGIPLAPDLLRFHLGEEPVGFFAETIAEPEKEGIEGIGVLGGVEQRENAGEVNAANLFLQTLGVLAEINQRDANGLIRYVGHLATSVVHLVVPFDRRVDVEHHQEDGQDGCEHAWHVIRSALAPLFAGFVHVRPARVVLQLHTRGAPGRDQKIEKQSRDAKPSVGPRQRDHVIQRGGNRMVFVFDRSSDGEGLAF